MLKKSVLAALLMMAVLSGYSLHRILPGYYVSLTGDTIRCNVTYGDWAQNPSTITVQANGESKEFKPEDIRGFGVDGYSDYQSAVISYHTNPIDGGFYPAEYSDSTVTKSCFLKIIQKNVYSLYSLTYSARTYFFMSAPDKPISELVYRVKSVNDSLREDQAYKDQIMALFNQEGITSEYFNRINNLGYSSKEIAYLFSVLNENHTGVKTVKKKSHGYFEFLAFGGIRNMSFPSTVNGYYMHGFKFPSVISPDFGIGMIYALPIHFNMLQVGLNLGYYAYSGSQSGSDSVVNYLNATNHFTTNYTDHVNMSNTIVYASLYTRYVFNPLDKTNVYLKAGANMNFSVGGNPDVQYDFHSVRDGESVNEGKVHQLSEYQGVSATVKKAFFSGLLGAGVEHGKAGLEFTYSPSVTIGESDLGYPAFKIVSWGLTAHYTFSSGKTASKQ